MKRLGKTFIDFQNNLKLRICDLITLTKDLESMKHGLANDKPYGRQTVEPMTRLRDSKEEAEEALANPNEQFIKDRLNDILGI